MSDIFKTLEILKPLIDKLSLLSFVEVVYLFGSRAKNNSLEKSDIDLAISCSKANDDDWNKILEIVNDNTVTLLKIDCIRLDKLENNSILKKEIEDSKIVLFERNSRNLYSLKLSFEMLEKAIHALRKAINSSHDVDNLNIDASIQRFEFVIELFWKTLKKILKNKGVEVQYPKDVLKQAYLGNLIEDEKIWLLMLNDRNQTSHTYDENLALKIYNRIKIDYLSVFEKTFSKLKKEFVAQSV